MININVGSKSANDGHGECKAEIMGSPSDIIREAIMVQMSLTKAVSEVMNISFEAASLFLMQQGNERFSHINEYTE